jgi:hypothetical protein
MIRPLALSVSWTSRETKIAYAWFWMDFPYCFYVDTVGELFEGYGITKREHLLGELPMLKHARGCKFAIVFLA